MAAGGSPGAGPSPAARGFRQRTTSVISSFLSGRWADYLEDSVADTKNLTGVRVMVIDDSNTIRRSAEIFLMQAGCQVILAENGFDALSKIADHQPDLIFVDIMMPRLDGYQTCALIKKSGKHRATPVIMLSSKDSLFDRARGRMVGSDEYLTKPFTKESLLKAVESHLAQRSPA
jgi:twitching motility two-component system response regulator PilG